MNDSGLEWVDDLFCDSLLEVLVGLQAAQIGSIGGVADR